MGEESVESRRQRWKQRRTRKLALGLTLLLARGFHLANQFVRSGEWLNKEAPLTTSMNGKKAGIFGLGRIGKAIARRLDACGMTVGYHDRSVQQVHYKYYPTLLEMAKDVEFLIIAASGSTANKNVVNAEVFAALGPRGSLINIARGSLVDEPALITALKNGSLGGAGLDVFANEPNVPAELLALDNVVLPPHVGSGTRETRKAMGDLVLANLAAHFAGKSLVRLIPELQSPG